MILKKSGKSMTYMKTVENNVKIAVIGGGASGMMAAIAAASKGAEVTLFEKNKSEKVLDKEKFFDNAYLGKKLLITGKGRCNVTNACNAQEFLANVPVNSKFLYASYNGFPSEKVMEFFENGGTALKVERGNRVFPVSDRAIDILKVLKNALRENGVKVVNKKITDVDVKDGIFSGVVTEDGKKAFFDRCIICTGGASYPVTGSDGDGYAFGEKAGHTLKEIKPSLVPLTSKDKCCRDMMGLSLRNVVVTVTDGEKKKPLYKEMGEMLFTHFGVSGPLVLSASSHMRNMSDGRYTLCIDLKPSLDEKRLDARLLSDFTKYSNKNMDNAMADLLPSKMIVPFLNKCSIAKEQKTNTLSKEQRRTILETLKCFKIEISGFRPVEEAIITSGGINVKEINPSTMESKIVKNLYFAGEVLDVDAYTGGFNLQIAFCTGYAAGVSASRAEND